MPAVLVLQPIVERLTDPERAWLVVAMSSTLAGNLTLVGSVANLIVAERARRSASMWGSGPTSRSARRSPSPRSRSASPSSEPQAHRAAMEATGSGPKSDALPAMRSGA
ncbi:hypothetical protein [Chenggangzhangella methanolivorans]|uniref:hypothetical protein n=1 Tax=Chenggangzhangella methanolivorans TaxID=1437009 RepID=UPI003D18685D